MGKDCCSPPAVGHETDITSLVPSGEKKSCCQGSCRCDSNDAEPSDTTNSGQKESALEELDDCCSPVDGKCEESQTEKDDDAPECCKGKVGPCCDTSCLDRLATRECELSATTALGLNSESNTKYEPGEKGFQ